MGLLFERTDGRYGRLRAAWRLLLQLAILVVALNLFASLLATLWFFVGAGRASLSGGLLAGSSVGFLLILSLASLGATVLSMWLAGRYLDRRRFVDFGLHLGRGWWLDFGFGVALGALLMAGIFLVELSLGWVTVTGTFRSVDPGQPFALALLAPVILFLSTGVYEEMLFRGYRIKNLAEGLNFSAIGPLGAILLAWALTSAYFGLRHAVNPNADLLSTVNIALAGVLLGIGYVLSGELAIPIGLHVAWNFFQGNVFGFPVSGLGPIGATFIAVEQRGPELWTGGAFGPEGGLLDPVAVLVGSTLIVLWMRLRRGKVEIHTPLAEEPAAVAADGGSGVADVGRMR